MKPSRFFLSLFLALCLMTPAFADRDTVSQFSTIDALLAGVYDGVATFGEALLRGDFGLGTVNELYGELIILDGVCYQVRADGTVHVLPEEETTPFVMLTFFESDGAREVAGLKLAELKTMLDSKILTKSNSPYAFRVKGTFQKLKLRSVAKQRKPYPPLAEVVKTQSIFTFEELEGTIVAFKTPAYLGGVSVPGYHLHFLSKDRTRGGHVLDLQIKSAEIEWDEGDSFFLQIPDDPDFQKVNLEKERSNELDTVER